MSKKDIEIPIITKDMPGEMRIKPTSKYVKKNIDRKLMTTAQLQSRKANMLKAQKIRMQNWKRRKSKYMMKKK